MLLYGAIGDPPIAQLIPSPRTSAVSFPFFFLFSLSSLFSTLRVQLALHRFGVFKPAA